MRSMLIAAEDRGYRTHIDRAIGSRGIRILIAASLITATINFVFAGVTAADAPIQASAVAVSIHEVDISWAGGPADAASLIGISRDGRHLANVGASSHRFVDNSVQAGTVYTYEIGSADGSGTPRGPLTTAKVKTPFVPEMQDPTPPSEPEGFSVTAAAGGGVYLDWYASTGASDITAYRIYRNAQLLVTLGAGVLSYVDTTAEPAHAYRYAIEAFDVVGQHSPFATASILMPRTNSIQPNPSGNASDPSPNAPGAATAAAAQGVASGYNQALRRYPYLTDAVANFMTVNWATDKSGSTGSVKYGKVSNGSCTPTTSVTATKTSMTVNGVGEYQWKAKLTLTTNTQYCYRIFLGSTDLLGSNATPRFWTQISNTSTQTYSFAVIGDWGQTDSGGANPNTANLMQLIANSGARFALTVGDNSYPSGTQTNYGDLQQTGANVSAIFGPSFWSVPGSSIPLFPALGNHGFASTASSHPQLQNFPEDQAVSRSGGSYSRVTYCCVNGTTSASYPNAWYAFDAGPARFYVLEAAWPDGNIGNGTLYQDDHDTHWTTSSPEYKWLQKDLSTHSEAAKFAFFHFPMFSDNATEGTDPFLQGSSSLQGLLDQYGVNISFFGHTHDYQRSTADAAGMAFILTGGGGAKLEPVGSGSTPCSANDAYAVGWSYSANGGTGGGSACGAAPKPTSPAQVFHFLLVTVGNGTITVKPTDSTGHVFDQHTFNY